MVFVQASLGRKIVLALSGLGLLAFLVLHIAGHLSIFGGQERYNGYAEFLHTSPVVLYTERISVLLLVLVHAVTAARLVAENRAARPRGYAVQTRVRATVFSRLMGLSGALILGLLVLHILHFTTQSISGAVFQQELLADGRQRANTFLMVYSAFKQPAVVALYVLGTALFGGHLWHGAQSTLQSLGVMTTRAALVMRALVVFVTVGGLAVPLGIYLFWPAL